MSNTFAKSIASIVILVGVIVMMGWFFDIQSLKSLLPQWVTMKFTTALCFVFSGAMLFTMSMDISARQESWKFVPAILSFLIILIMASFLVSVLFGIKTGIEDLIVKESPNAVKTTVGGRPSVVTMIVFILIAFNGIWYLNGVQKIVRGTGLTIALIGATAIVGYIVNNPVLYFNIAGISTAMAFHTAILFVLLGIGFFAVSRRQVVIDRVPPVSPMH
jgi:hypothetical protein